MGCEMKVPCHSLMMSLSFQKSFNDHVKHIKTVLQRLIEKGIKLKASKCGLFKKEVKYLGRVVNKEGYKMDEANIKSVKGLKGVTPKKVGEVRQLLGLLGYHRRHVQDFSKIAKPITDLLIIPTGEPQNENKNKISKGKDRG